LRKDLLFGLVGSFGQSLNKLSTAAISAFSCDQSSTSVFFRLNLQKKTPAANQ